MTEESTKAPTDIENLTFRQAMDELSEIVSSLEDNSLELEESLKRYERGAAPFPAGALGWRSAEG